MESVIELVRKERARQDELWGESNHKPIEWVAILTEEVGEVSKEALELHFQNGYADLKNKYAKRKILNYKEELVQVASVAIAMVECLERGEWND